MNSPTPDLQAVVERLERLEVQNRSLRQRGTVALLLAATGLLAAAVLLIDRILQPYGAVEANEFIARDHLGNSRVQLQLREDGPSLVFCDAFGKETLRLHTHGEIPILYLSDKKGNVLWQAP